MYVSRVRPTRFGVLAGLLVLTAAGCSESPPSGKTPQRPAEEAQTAAAPARETWDITSILGSRVGYTHTTVRNITHDGQKALRIVVEDHLDVQRSGQRIKPGSRVTSIETPDGNLLQFESEMQLGPSPMRTVGRVVGGRLEMQTSSQGQIIPSSIPWPADCRGPFAAAESLLRHPMRPGQRRAMRLLVPGFNQLAELAMTATDYESVTLPTGNRELLRIDTELRFSNGQVLQGSTWTDRNGDTLKTRVAALNTERIRATSTLALEEPESLDLDLLWDLAVKVDRRLPDAHRTRRIRYRVEVADGDPAEVFVSGPSQQVKSTGPHTAELTVYAIRGDRPGGNPDAPDDPPGGNPDAPDDPPGEEDRQPNNLIQSDHATIVAMARMAAGEEKNPWKTAIALERYVSQWITRKDFSQAFATAAEVAANPTGDCTEHAVLLAALARARGIPARAAVGLVYMQGKGSFGYHMWNQVHVDGRWIPLDATLGQGGIGAAHLKLAHTSLKGASAYSSFLPVIQVIGRLKIEVLEVE